MRFAAEAHVALPACPLWCSQGLDRGSPLQHQASPALGASALGSSLPSLLGITARVLVLMIHTILNGL